MWLRLSGRPITLGLDGHCLHADVSRVKCLASDRAVPLACRRAGHFLCFARESNQREATLATAVAGEAGDFARALRRFADRPSLA
jgi:hypothetical protein